MKKILIIPSWYPNIDNPGLGSFIREQAALFETDFDVRIMAGNVNRNIPRIKKLANTIFFRLFKKTDIQAKNDYFIAPPAVFGFTYNLGVNWMEKANFKMMLQSWMDNFEKDVLADWKPDLIHAQNTNIAGIISRHIFLKHNIPYIITDHHPCNPNLPRYILDEMNESFQRSAINIFVSQWQYRTYLLLDKSINGCVVGNPVNTEIFNIQKNKKKTNFVITHLSNADKPKDIETLLRTLEVFFSKIDNHAEVKVRIVGFPDNIIKQIENVYINFEWYRSIELLRPQSRESVVKILNKSDVFLFTSVSESFGIAPLEAMMCGIPVIASDNGAINDYIINGINGMLCNMKDYNALAEQLIKIFKKELVFSSTEIRNSVKDKHSINAFKKKISEYYSKI